MTARETNPYARETEENPTRDRREQVWEAPLPSAPARRTQELWWLTRDDRRARLASHEFVLA